MGQKRKPQAAQNGAKESANKKPKYHDSKTEKGSRLLFTPRADWHAAELPPLEPKGQDDPRQRTIEELHKYATKLLEEENAAYNASHMSGSSSNKFLSTIMSSGTLEDKISALTLLVQESPLHTTKAFENLLGLSKKKSRNQALMAVAALKDLLGQGVVLPGDRKLRAFGKQPGLLGALQGDKAQWRPHDPLPNGLEKIHLLVWAFEDWLKRSYFELLQILETWCSDEVEYARSRAVTYVFELLKDKPEQEENLLRLMVNKIGDSDRKIASRVSFLLLQIENTHPAMKMVITDSIEADCLFRPGQSMHAKYYAVITLNQTILRNKEEKIANRLLAIYLSLFIQLLKPKEKNPERVRMTGANGMPQGGGGKAGKAAAKKRKAEEKTEEADDQLREKMTAQVLAGVNRAFPYADTSDPTFEKQIDLLFRVTHSANFNTAIQALMLIQQISSTKHYSAERFYRTLYESLLDPRLINSSKQIMYLNLLYKSLKSDLNAKRVQSFVKRLLQVITMHEPPFVCGVLYLISELETSFPSIRNMMKDPEVDDEDEEEHYQDVPEDEEDAPGNAPATQQPYVAQTRYDPKKRDPEHAHADRSCLWDLLPFLQHFHPSVSLFADRLLFNQEMPPKPDPTSHTLMHFLDRFVYKSAPSKPGAAMHGSSIMQPMAGSSAADLLVKPGREGAARNELNSEAFWRKNVADVAPDEVFFHSYFNQAGNKKRKGLDKKEKKVKADDDESGEDEDEDQIWKAITASRPDVEGPDEDDDLSMGDLESAYSDSDDGSEGGIDLGGDGEDDGEGAEEMEEDFEGEMPQDGSEAEDMDGMPDLESEDDAMFDDEANLPEDFEPTPAAEQSGDEGEDGEKKKELSRSQKQRKEKKKLKSLPTFASADDYARLLGQELDSDDGTK